MRLSLDLVEEGIAVDPYHRVGREEIDGIIHDMTEPGILVAYSLSDDEIVLLTFRNLFHPG